MTEACQRSGCNTCVVPFWGFSLDNFAAGNASHGEVLRLQTQRTQRRKSQLKQEGGKPARQNSIHSNLIIVRLTTRGGSRRRFLLLSRRLLGHGRHSGRGWSAGHKDELRGDGGPQGAVDLQDDNIGKIRVFKVYHNTSTGQLLPI